MIIGAHQSIAGGYEKALESIDSKGGNSLQIFSSSPRGWNFAKPTEEQIDTFLMTNQDLKIDPVYFHASYLVNFADMGRTGKISIKMLSNELNLAAKMEVKGSIVHLGSFKEKETALFSEVTNGQPTPSKDEKYTTLIENIEEVLITSPKDVFFIIENAGNRKIGQTIDEIGRIVHDVNDPRIKVCLDTCHLHAAGYDLRTTENFEKFLEEFDTKVGLDRLEVVHVNDSKDPFGSLRDRHENLGQGQVGDDVFRNLLNHPKTKHLSFIIETPGFDDNGPDKKNIDILKNFLK